MMLRMLIAVAALLFAVPAMAEPDADAVKAEVMAKMQDSAAGWNNGDLDRFLAVYSDNPETSFTGSSGIARGKTGIRARYLLSYASQFGEKRTPASMSRLSFTLEDFRLIGPYHALLIARWKLVTNGDEANAKTGMTSLLFDNEIAGGWEIVADHSS
jgi:ketosteroid isomerase-like protein